MTKLNADLYIFDDLERCEAPINKVLGYINQFVEHDDAKVIIVANEQEIGSAGKTDDGSDEDYKRRREKLIGKTLEVQSAFDDAFSHFASKLDDAGKQFIEKTPVNLDALCPIWPKQSSHLAADDVGL